MNAVVDEPSTALTLPQRAEVALGETANVAKLRELASQSAGIVAVTNADGRAEAHRAGMVLRTMRTTITATGKAAREDATAFSKAVIAKEKELIAIIEPEEVRVLALRDEFDAAEQARKDALIAAERARVQAIQDRIQVLAHLPVKHAGATAAELAEVITEYDGWAPDETFEELADKAKQAVDLSLMALRDLLTARQQQEQKVAREAEERQAEAARLEIQRQALAAQAAENARIAAEVAADRQRLADEAAAQQAAAKARQDAVDAAAKAERDAAARRTAQIQAELDEQRAELAEQQRSFAARQLAAEQARILEQEHGEALGMNEEFNLLRATAPAQEATAELLTPHSADVEQLLDMADAAGPLLNLPPISDNEIIERVASFFGLNYIEAVDRLEEIDFETAREVNL